MKYSIPEPYPILKVRQVHAQSTSFRLVRKIRLLSGCPKIKNCTYDRKITLIKRRVKFDGITYDFQ